MTKLTSFLYRHLVKFHDNRLYILVLICILPSSSMAAYITSIGTANPANKYSQEALSDFMCENLRLSDREQKELRILYRATGIQQRYSVLDDYKRKKGAFTFYPNTIDLEPFPSTENRMKLYREKSVPLCIEAIVDCMNGESDFSQFTHIITVSCTGMYAPGLDVDLIKALGMDPGINRISLNFMGCYAAMPALKMAKQYCQTAANARVLIVSVELCSLHLQKNKTEDNLLANSLFSDGAAAVIVTAESPSSGYLEIVESNSFLSINGKNDMAWQIGDFGFQMALTSYVPKIIESGIKELTDRLLKISGFEMADMDAFAIHPGGKKILESIEKELGITKDDNRHAYEVLKNYGNMSSPTILFVLKKYMEETEGNRIDQKILSFAFGPGLTMESMIFRTN